MSYLGWPLLILLPAAAICFWRDPKVRAAAVTWVLIELLSLGGGSPMVDGSSFPVWLLPYHWLQGLPVSRELLPNRFCLLADGAAPPCSPSPSTAQAYWRPAAVVAVASQQSWPARVLTDILGQPTSRAGGLLAWRL
jgi:hypothetical protein